MNGDIAIQGMIMLNKLEVTVQYALASSANGTITMACRPLVHLRQGDAIEGAVLHMLSSCRAIKRHLLELPIIQNPSTHESTTPDAAVLRHISFRHYYSDSQRDVVAMIGTGAYSSACVFFTNYDTQTSNIQQFK